MHTERRWRDKALWEHYQTCKYQDGRESLD